MLWSFVFLLLNIILVFFLHFLKLSVLSDVRTGKKKLRRRMHLGNLQFAERLHLSKIFRMMKLYKCTSAAIMELVCGLELVICHVCLHQNPKHMLIEESRKV